MLGLKLGGVSECPVVVVLAGLVDESKLSIDGNLGATAGGCVVVGVGGRQASRLSHTTCIC